MVHLPYDSIPHTALSLTHLGPVIPPGVEKERSTIMTAATIGYMPMPISFPHKNLFLHGRPKHRKFDDFWCKHPPMDHVHRAKIFAPFDALAGFDEEIASKEVLYEKKRMLTEYQCEDLNRKLGILRALTYNSRVARENRPTASITYFSPCADPHNDWYGRGGRYEEITGTIWKVDNLISRTITVDDQNIPLKDVYGIDLISPADTDIRSLRTEEGKLTEFKEDTWSRLLDYATAYTDGRLVFTFKNGQAFEA